MEIAKQPTSLNTQLRARLNALVENPLPLFIAIFAVFVLVFAASIFLIPKRYGRLIVGDGIYYYVYLRSAVLDRDLDFTNDYTIYQEHNEQDAYKKEEMLSRRTPTGMAGNWFSVGPAVLWAPVFLVTHLVASALGAATDGFSYGYEAPLLFLSIAYGFVGILLMYRVAADMFSRLAALVAILGIWLATNVMYYMGVSPSASHVLSLFACALFVYLWGRGNAPHPSPLPRGEGVRGRTRVGWFVWGLSAGLMALVRWQDSLIALLALFEWVRVWRENRKLDGAARMSMGALLLNGVLFLVGALVAFLPQMLVWNVLYGTPLTIPQGEGFLDFFRPEIWNVWFSTKRGLFPWSPVLVLAVIGFVPLYWKNRTLGAAAVVIFLLQSYINSIVSDWWGGEAFGARRFISLMPFFVLGLAAFIDWIRPRVPQTAMWITLGALILWNSLFLLQYNLWLHGIGQISSFPTLREMTLDKFTAPFLALERLRGR